MADAEVRDEVPPVQSPVTGARALAPHAEALPSYGLEGTDIDYMKMLQKFKERAMFVDGVRREALARTQPQHWLSRKAKNGTVTYSLMGPGAERLRTVAPIGFVDEKQWTEEWRKDAGPGYTVYFSARVYLGSERTGLLPVLGSCSSDDDFFSTERVELPYNAENPEHKLALESGEGTLSHDKTTIFIRRQIPSAEVTKENIVKSALMNLIVNGVTRVLGIRSISEKELTDCGIDPKLIPGFEYGSTKAASGQLSPAEEQKRTEIKKMLVEMNGGDEAKALKELKSRTAFNDYQGCQGWDRITVKQLDRKYPEIKADYDAFREGQPQKENKSQAGAAKGEPRTTGGKPSGAEPGPAQGGQKSLL
jgi:hypothetical protein